MSKFEKYDITTLDPSNGKGCDHCLVESRFSGHQFPGGRRNDNYRDEIVILSEERQALTKLLNMAIPLKGKVGADSKKYNLNPMTAVLQECPGLGVCIRECRRATFTLESSFLSMKSLLVNQLVHFQEPSNNQERDFLIDTQKHCGDYTSVNCEDIPAITENGRKYLGVIDDIFNFRIHTNAGGMDDGSFDRCMNGEMSPQDLSKQHKVYLGNTGNAGSADFTTD